MSRGVVLMYHRLGQGELPGREAGEALYAILPETFDRQLEILEATRCAVLGFPAVAQAALMGQSMPARSVALTFDDGNATDHSHALPALLRRGHSAAFFITPAWVDTPGYMSWDQVRDLVAHGMTVGAHGLDHTPLRSLADAELRSHLREARAMMEARLGTAPEYLSFPGGAGGPREVAAATEAGFRLTIDSVPRRLSSSRGGRPVPRFAVRRQDTLAGFRALVEQQPLTLFKSSLRHGVLVGFRGVVGEALYKRARTALTSDKARVG